eukprot:gb/GECG01005334.1/.p1 GENE.gb/GECG01005334.1/~~gb/GECG01005334.1/.p1  ORF type:complete len:412 (+),score=16.10 gb/GECG01005334.1/:1-1236(+)
MRFVIGFLTLVCSIQNVHPLQRSSRPMEVAVFVFLPLKCTDANSVAVVISRTMTPRLALNVLGILYPRCKLPLVKRVPVTKCRTLSRADAFVVTCMSFAFSENKACQPCGAGLIPNNNQTFCFPCAAYEISGATDALCHRCGKGFKPNANQTECLECADNEVSGLVEVSCRTCAEGKKPDFEQGRCVCDYRYEFATSENETCRVCGAGLVPNSEQNGCRRCPEYAVAGDFDTSCKICGIGFIPNANQTKCRPCLDTEVSAYLDSSCTNCSEDKEPDSSKLRCICRNSYEFAPSDTVACQPCAVGRISTNQRTSCTRCAAYEVSGVTDATTKYQDLLKHCVNLARIGKCRTVRRDVVSYDLEVFELNFLSLFPLVDPSSLQPSQASSVSMNSMDHQAPIYSLRQGQASESLK